MCLLRQLRDTWPRQLDLVCIGADARWRNMRGPGNRKRSKKGFNTEHTEKKLKPQVTQRKNIGNARWIRRTSRHSMNSLCETRRLELLLCGLCVKALLCDAANPPGGGRTADPPRSTPPFKCHRPDEERDPPPADREARSLRGPPWFSFCLRVKSFLCRHPA